MGIAISRLLLAQITGHAARSADEVCGLLFGDEGTILAARACANVAAEPAKRFEIDPRALIAAHRAAREGGVRPIGHYHSHPGGIATPSPRDAADAVADGAVWLIVADGAARAWRAIGYGGVEGMFAPLDLVIADP